MYRSTSYTWYTGIYIKKYSLKQKYVMFIWIQCRCWFVLQPRLTEIHWKCPYHRSNHAKDSLMFIICINKEYSITVVMGSCDSLSLSLCKVGLDIYIYSYSFFQLFMLTCQLLMSTCQKIIITITSSIYWFYRVLMSLTSIYLLIWHLTYRHQYLISRYSFLTSRQNDLADKLT